MTETIDEMTPERREHELENERRARMSLLQVFQTTVAGVRATAELVLGAKSPLDVRCA